MEEKKYILQKDDCYQRLEDKVNYLIGQGYMVSGGLIAVQINCRNYYFQAMVKYE